MKTLKKDAKENFSDKIIANKITEIIATIQ